MPRKAPLWPLAAAGGPQEGGPGHLVDLARIWGLLAACGPPYTDRRGGRPRPATDRRRCAASWGGSRFPGLADSTLPLAAIRSPAEGLGRGSLRTLAPRQEMRVGEPLTAGPLAPMGS